MHDPSRILVVEDNEANIHTSKMQLKSKATRL